MPDDDETAAVTKAKQLVEDARNEAERIIMKANSEAHLTQKDAKAQYEKERKLLIISNTSLIKELADHYEERFINLQNAIAKITMAVSKTIIGQEPEIEVLLNLIKSNLSCLDGNGTYQLMLHPSQVQFIESTINELNKKFPNQKLQIVSNKHTSLGSCRLTGPSVDLEISPDIAVKSIEANFIKSE